MKNITLQTLRDWDACSEGYDKIAKHVSENEVIDLDLALEVTSIPDVVWVLSHDPDKHRWLSFLADMINFPGCKVIVQAVRDYRDGRATSEDLRKIAFRATASDAAARDAAYTAAYADSDASDASHAASHAAYTFISISGKPRLIKLIRSYYQ